MPKYVFLVISCTHVHTVLRSKGALQHWNLSWQDDMCSYIHLLGPYLTTPFFTMGSMFAKRKCLGMRVNSVIVSN